MEPRDVQARVVLSAHLFKESLRGVVDALKMIGAAPLTPEEKERLLANVEKTVWDLPESLMRNSEEEGWEDAVSDDPRVRVALEAAIEPILLARKKQS